MSVNKSFFIFLLLTNMLLTSIVFSEGFSFENSNAELEDFRTFGKGKNSLDVKDKAAIDKKSVWNIHGKRAKIRGDFTDLFQFVLKITDKDEREITITSPQCEYNQQKQEIKSTATLLVVSRGLRITGIGYDLYFKDNQKVLVIRNTAHLFLHRKQFNTKK